MSQHLFSEFNGINSQQWKDQIVKDLKGIDFNQLIWQTRQGISVNPFYTSEDIKETKAPLFSSHNWSICEQIEVHDEKKANEQALQALKGGASGLVFYIFKKIDTQALIKGIELDYIYTQFFISNDAIHVLEDLKEHTGRINTHDGVIKCFVNLDPLSMLAYFGEWHKDEPKDLSVLKQLKHIPVNASLYQEAGAHAVNELAVALAHLNEYIHYLSESKAWNNQTILANFSVGSDFFNEIAKLRAFRQLVNLLQKQYQINLPLHLHVQTSLLNKSSLDAYNNMLRTTTEGMSAVIGGCDSLCVLPYNTGFEETTEFSSRISRNQQHLYKEESYLNQVADMAAGSYYIETLTDQMAEKAWEQFKQIESKGGFIETLKSGYIQELIERDAEELLRQVKDSQIILVGVNKYQNPKDQIKSTQMAHQSESTAFIKAIRPIRLAESFELEKINATAN